MREGRRKEGRKEERERERERENLHYSKWPSLKLFDRTLISHLLGQKNQRSLAQPFPHVLHSSPAKILTSLLNSKLFRK